MFRALLFGLAVAAASAGFECKDKSEDCPEWKSNMNGDCKGEDYQYMLANCPVTCGMCDEANEKWVAADAEAKKSPTYEGEDSAVYTLDIDTIDDFIEEEQENSLILLEFYAPWCGHCKQVAPAFRAAAKEMARLSEAGQIKTPVKFAKFDDQHPDNRAYERGPWNFTSYPTMYLIGGSQKFSMEGGLPKMEDKSPNDGSRKHWYNGQNDNEEGLVHWMTDLANGKTIKQAWYSWLDVEKGKKPGMYKEGGEHETTLIVDLNHEDFQDTVLRSDAMWVIEFYSDKCPICRSMAPELIKAAEKMKTDYPNGDLRFGAVNARVYDDLGEPFKITGHPWVASFYLGKKVEDMAGMGGWESFYNFGKNWHTKLWNAENKADLEAVIPPMPKKDDDDDEDEDDESSPKDEL